MFNLTLPRAILRKASEKAGAGMCRLDFFDCPAFTGMEFPTACQSKKPAVYRQRAFSYFRDSVGIRTQDPQLRRLLLYPAELPNHPCFAGAKVLLFFLSCKCFGDSAEKMLQIQVVFRFYSFLCDTKKTDVKMLFLGVLTNLNS